MIISSNIGFSQIANYVPSNGLVGWYPFSGNANDASINANNGTVSGATLTTDRFGNTDNAYSFNGTNSYISIPNIAQTGYSALTISAWIKTSDRNGLCIISTGNAGTPGISFNLVVGYGTSVAYPGKLGVMGFFNDLYPQTGHDVNDNIWHLVVATYDGAGNIKTYVDGLIDNSDTKTYNTSGQVNFVGKSNHTTWPQYFNGAIDDIGFWNRALTQQEISALYNGNICYQSITVTDTLIINANILGFAPLTYANTIKIYPNPTNDQITIDYGNYTSLAGYTLKITNSLGQTVFTSPINQQTSSVALSSWTGNGIYFVYTIDGQGNSIDVKKIILQ